MFHVTDSIVKHNFNKEGSLNNVNTNPPPPTANNGKKKIAAIIAIVLTLAIGLGGALAFTDFGQSFINRFRGSANPDILLHDDFEAGVNKDVYVENTGETPMIVRVQFAEYLQIGNTPIVGEKANDKSTWDVRLFNTAPADDGEYLNGANDDGAMPTENRHIWYMTGAQKIFKPGTGEMGSYEYQLNQEFDDGSKAKLTLGESPVVLVQYYIDHKVQLDQAFPEGLWALDTDGYAYWTRALQPGEATNLLLDNVVLDEKLAPDDNYYYAIDVRLEASNLTESYLLYSGEKKATEYGEAIIKDAVTTAYDALPAVVNAQTHRLTPAQTGDTADWLAIARQTVNGQKYYLIVRSEVTGTSPFDGEEPWTNIYTNGDSELKTAMDDWWNGFSGALKEDYAVAHNALETLGTIATVSPYTGFSAPAASGEFKGIFPLSANEVAEYMSKTWHNGSGNLVYNTSDRTSTGVKLPAYTNWEALEDEESVASWLRSPSTTYLNYASFLNIGGHITFDAVRNSNGIRPALWVRAEIFDTNNTVEESIAQAPVFETAETVPDEPMTGEIHDSPTVPTSEEAVTEKPEESEGSEDHKVK